MEGKFQLLELECVMSNKELLLVQFSISVHVLNLFGVIQTITALLHFYLFNRIGAHWQ